MSISPGGRAIAAHSTCDRDTDRAMVVDDIAREGRPPETDCAPEASHRRHQQGQGGRKGLPRHCRDAGDEVAAFAGARAYSRVAFTIENSSWYLPQLPALSKLWQENVAHDVLPELHCGGKLKLKNRPPVAPMKLLL